MEIVNVKIDKLRWRTEKRKINNLIPFEGNPRKMTKEQAEQLQKSLEKFNLAEIPAIDIDNKIIAGHQRIKILKMIGRGEEIIDVRIPNRKLTDDEFREYNLRSNRNTGSWDFDELANLDVDLLTDVGFSEEELDIVMDNVVEPEEDDFDIDKAVEEVGEPICKIGQLWQLNSHRLLCGDATVEEDVKRLMDGEKADMVFTDPPYGIDLDTDYNKLPSTKKEGNKTYSPIVGDDKQFNYQDFKWIKCNEQVWFGANYYAKTLPNGGSWLVWDKRVEEKFDKMFGSGFEIGWSKTPHKQKIYRYNNTLFGGDIEAKGKLHPTQKPTKLCINIINDYLKDGNIVLDLFGGSGSTLIACEQLNRKCYMMEIDPIYIQIILERYIKYKGTSENVFLLKDNKKISYKEIFV